MTTFLILLTAIALITLLIGAAFTPRHLLGQGIKRFEEWYGHSWTRALGLPLLLAICTITLGRVTGQDRSLLEVLASAYILFLLYGFVHACFGRRRVRPIIQLGFLTCLFSAILSMLGA